MEVVDSRSSLLTNTEVLQLLREVDSATKSGNRSDKSSNLATVVYEAIKFLEKTPCQVQSGEDVGKLAEALAPFKLTRVEILQILNLRPTSEAEIQLIVEESEERLKEEDMEKLIQIVKNTLPPLETK